jgi:hypothetical protein
LQRLPKEWPWLIERFGSEEEYWIACVGYLLAMNFAELLWQVRRGQPFDVIRRDREHGPTVPPHYIDESTDIQRQAVRLLSRDREGLRTILGARMKVEAIHERWAQWVTFQETWHSLESGGSTGGSAPHPDLIELLLDDQLV